MRPLVAAILALIAALAVAADDFAAVRPDTVLSFPRDHGAHPAFRTEWWYVTGWLRDVKGSAVQQTTGFQLTFFRVRSAAGTENPSRFAPEQVLFAHVAIADPRKGSLLHEERIARAGLGLAEAREGDTAVWIGDWSLKREGGVYHARIAGRELSFELGFSSDREPLLQGEQGFSRKGPDARHASHYYSRPQLAVRGRVGTGSQARSVVGRAWLDHEWSSGYLPEGAVGWDWLGLNLDDGGALMAFRMRDAAGKVLWSSASWMAPGGEVERFGPAAVAFTPLRRWRSPRSGAEYPVAMTIDIGGRRLRIEPLMDDQELDARAGTGTLYWEGAVRVYRDDRELGRGYLELTGYWRPMRM